MPIQIINPLEIPNWDSLVLRHPTASVFHTAGWARVLLDTYGFKPCSACVFKGEVLTACLPLLEVNRFLTGKRGISLPFTDFCEPLLNGTVSSRDLFEFAVNLGKDRHWKYLELRSSDFSLERNERDKRNERDELANPYMSFSHHILDLSPGVDKLYKNVRESTRRNLGKAGKEGVSVRFATDLESARTYFRLHCLTRKRHGGPPQPWSFFENIYTHRVAAGRGFVALADYQGKPIAGAVFFTFGDQAIFKFGASDRKYHSVRPNNLIMWETIRRLAETGLRSLSFGRTDPEHKGLIQFKSGWGGREKTSAYTRFDFKTRGYLREIQNPYPRYTRIFQKFPTPFLRALGNLFYKHL